MMLQRTVENSAGHQSRPVTMLRSRAESCSSRPDLPEQHIVVQFLRIWVQNAHGAPSCRYFSIILFSFCFFETENGP